MDKKNNDDLKTCIVLHKELDQLLEDYYHRVKYNLEQSKYELEEISNKIKKLFNASVEEKYFWQFCDSQTYQLQFETRLTEYIAYFRDSTIKEFVEYERTTINGSFKVYENSIFNESPIFILFSTSEDKLPSYLFCDGYIEVNINNKLLLEFHASQKRKIEFLDQCIASPNLYENTLPSQELVLELDSVGQKIIYLKETGILDLIIKNFPVKSQGQVVHNMLAHLIAPALNEKQTTIVRILNDIFTVGKAKNNPYNNKKNKELVDSSISKLIKKYGPDFILGKE